MANTRSVRMTMAIAIAIAVMIAAEIQVTKAADCNPVLLEPCLPAVEDPHIAAPPKCCTNLKAQQPCFCQYLKNPVFKKYLTAPGAKKVAQTCGVTFPTSCPGL